MENINENLLVLWSNSSLELELFFKNESISTIFDELKFLKSNEGIDLVSNIVIVKFNSTPIFLFVYCYGELEKVYTAKELH